MNLYRELREVDAGINVHRFQVVCDACECVLSEYPHHDIAMRRAHIHTRNNHGSAVKVHDRRARAGYPHLWDREFNILCWRNRHCRHEART